MSEAELNWGKLKGDQGCIKKEDKAKIRIQYIEKTFQQWKGVAVFIITN